MRNLAKGFQLIQPSVLGGIFISLLVGFGFYYATVQSIEENAHERFLNMSRAMQNTIVARIKTYTDVLRSTTSLFESTEHVSRKEFSRYVNQLKLEVNYPAVESLNFAFQVSEEDRPAFERRMKEEQKRDRRGQPEFRIFPPGSRPEYLVVAYIEPKRAMQGPTGWDIYTASPGQRKAAVNMRDKILLQSSGEPIRAISKPNQLVLAMRMPAYRAEMPMNTVAERRAAYVGSTGVAFHVPKLVQGVLAEMPVKNLRMRLIDVGTAAPDKLADTPSAQRLLYDSLGTEQNPSPPYPSSDNVFLVEMPVDFNGRVWRAVFSTEKSNLYTHLDQASPKLMLAVGLIGSLAIYALFYTLTSSRRRAISIAQEMTVELRDSEARLQASHDSLQRLAAHAEHIKEEERKRIAREIHDELGQNLLALRIEAQMLASRTDGQHSRLNERARWTLSQIDRAVKSVRQIINDLRPNVLDLGLGAAVEWQIAEFVRRAGIRCELIGEHGDVQLSDSVATALFRILQESLTNIERHAQATKVSVTLQVSATQISIVIADNGIGFDNNGKQAKAGSFGLVGIEERIRILGGTFMVTSVPGRGTTVAVSVSLEHVHTPGVATVAPSSHRAVHQLA